jgi:hypothetical protein
MLIHENGCRFIEGHAVFPLVGPILRGSHSNGAPTIPTIYLHCRAPSKPILCSLRLAVQPRPRPLCTVIGGVKARRLRRPVGLRFNSSAH